MRSDCDCTRLDFVGSMSSEPQRILVSILNGGIQSVTCDVMMCPGWFLCFTDLIYVFLYCYHGERRINKNSTICKLIFSVTSHHYFVICLGCQANADKHEWVRPEHGAPELCWPVPLLQEVHGAVLAADYGAAHARSVICHSYILFQKPDLPGVVIEG